MTRKTRNSRNRLKPAKRSLRRLGLGLERLDERVVLSGTPPVANKDRFELFSGDVLDVAAPGILSNDTDAEGDILTARLFSGVSHGALTLNDDGSFQYTPDAGFSCTDSFLYRASDGTGLSKIAAVTLKVVEGGHAPVSLDDAYVTDEDQELVIPAVVGVLSNDSDADGDAITAILVTPPTSGSVVLAADGSFTYTPDANVHGTDSFTYVANDGTQDGNIATVTITVNSVNDLPTAADDDYDTDEDTALVIDIPGVLGNDSDIDGDTLTAVISGGPAHGSVTLNADG